MTARSLYLFRHGKSAWDEPLPDRERPLAPRGQRAASLVGRFLSRIDEAPDRVLVSTATRARETAARAGRAGDWSATHDVVVELYGATAAELLAIVGQQGRTERRLAVVAHEPTLSQAIGALCGRVQVRFPTAAVARIDVDVVAWADIVPGAGELRWLVTPRLLRSAGHT